MFTFTHLLDRSLVGCSYACGRQFSELLRRFGKSHPVRSTKSDLKLSAIKQQVIFSCTLSRTIPLVIIICYIALSRDVDSIQTSRSVVIMSKGNVVGAGKCLFPVVRIAEAEVLCECSVINRFTRRDLIYTALIWKQIRLEFGRKHLTYLTFKCLLKHFPSEL